MKTPSAPAINAITKYSDNSTMVIDPGVPADSLQEADASRLIGRRRQL